MNQPKRDILQVFELEACVDCVLFLANGDLDDDDLPDRIKANWGDVSDITADSFKTDVNRLHWQLVADGGRYYEFSSSACECCNSGLAGDRYQVNALLVRD